MRAGATSGMNIVLLTGIISSAPVARDMPSGAKILSFELATFDSEGVAALVPVSWIDPPLNVTLEHGAEVTVIGNVRRTFFRAGGVTQSRTGVLADTVITDPNSADMQAIAAAAMSLATIPNRGR